MLKRLAHILVMEIECKIMIFKIKWIKGECRHLCVLCKYKNECYDNLELSGINYKRKWGE